MNKPGHRSVVTRLVRLAHLAGEAAPDPRAKGERVVPARAMGQQRAGLAVRAQSLTRRGVFVIRTEDPVVSQFENLMVGKYPWQYYRPLPEKLEPPRFP